jgi:hypothetical protein
MANGDANYVWTEAALVGVVEMRNGGVGKLHVVDQRAYGSQLCTTNNELELGGIISGHEIRSLWLLWKPPRKASPRASTVLAVPPIIKTKAHASGPFRMGIRRRLDPHEYRTSRTRSGRPRCLDTRYRLND